MKRSAALFITILNCLLFSTGCKKNPPVAIPIPPTVTAISPVSGPAGTVVTITGTNFKTTAADNTVKFNGTAATVTSATGTTLTVTAPAGGTTGKVTVSTADGTATGPVFTYAIIPPPPTVTAISPVSGPAGTVVIITGTNFKTTTTDNTVKFNGTAATVQSATATSVTVAAPAGGTSGAVSVTTTDGTAAGPVFTYTTPPTITAISPVSGAAGTVVTITGTNFKTTAADNTVKFNGVAATVQSASATSITVAAPSTGTTGAVTVVTADGAATGPVFTYVAAGADVYVVGKGITGWGYWKNGVFTAMPANCAELRSIFVDGTDVYVAGADASYGPAYWKNGVIVTLPMTAGHNGGTAYSVFVSGTDVYAAGFDMVNGSSALPRCWKNGTALPVSLSTGNISNGLPVVIGYVYQVVVSGSDVYMAGAQSPFSGNQVATWWKNGTPNPLTDGTSVCEAKGIALSGSDVYVTSNDGTIPKYWKNGVATVLNTPNNAYSANPTGIYVSGSDVYVSGFYRDIAKYWKGSTMVDLTATVPGGSNYEYATGVTGKGTDIYICGNEISKGYGYWKNDVFTALSGVSNIINGIFVK
jgi:hypothetical protein